MRPVDSHCHLNFEQFDTDRDDVIEKSKSELEFIVNVGTGPENNKKVLNLKERYPKFIKANIGLHPVYTDSFSDIKTVKDQIQENNPAAIGEIGLDHHHITEESLRNEQERVFREMLELAEDISLPVAIHSREAEEKAADIVSEYDVRAFFHCFNGSISLAQEIINEGHLIGVTTQVLYSDHIKEIADKIDLKHILLETDSPYLYREKRNEPMNVRESARRISEIKGVDIEDVFETTTNNALNFFQESSH